MENMENMENMEKMENINTWLKKDTLYMIQNTLFVTQKTPFVNQITKKTLFYGIYGEMWRNVEPWNMHRSNDWATEGLRGRRQEGRLLSRILKQLPMPTRVLSSQSRREEYNCYLTDSCYVCVTWWPLGGPRLAPNLGLNELRLMPTHFRCLTRRN